MGTAVIDQVKLDEFVMRAVSDLSAGYGGVMVSLGHKLGLYRALAGAGPLTAAEVAARAGCADRYVREWLNSQAAGGYVEYHVVSDTYELSPEQALVLADEDSPVFIPNAWNTPASMWFDEPKAIHAFRTGQGISWADHDDRLYCGVASFYRNGYRASLVPQWLPALDGVVERLEEGITVADVGCGYGYSTVMMAQAFPRSRFHGFDTHRDSVDEARKIAAAEGVADRVRFDVAPAAEVSGGPFGLICFFDVLHDLGDPVAAASRAAALLAPGGTVMLVEPFANDHVADNRSVVARAYYAASTMLCVPHAIAEGGPLALGAQAGEARLADVFRKAGFTRFRRAAETPFNLVLEARL